MYATDRRQTKASLNASILWGWRHNNTHLLTYCGAQLTQTVNTVFSMLALVLAYVLAYKTCSYSYSSLPCIIAPWNECSRERSLPGTKVPGNESSRERKFLGTFVPGSERSQWELSLRGAKIPGSEKSLSLNQSNHNLYSKRRHRNKVAISVIYQSYFTGDWGGFIQGLYPCQVETTDCLSSK